MTYKIAVTAITGKGYTDIDDAMFDQLVLPGDMVNVGEEVYRLTGGGAIKIDPKTKEEIGSIQPKDYVFDGKEWRRELSPEEIKKRIVKE